MTLCLRLNNWVIATTAAHKALAKTIGLASGISVNQYRILARLQAFERFDQMRSLAKTLSLHPSTVTMTIKELEAMNLVKTQWDKDDRRNTVVLCTERSVQLIKDIDREIVDQVRQIWELYTTDELLLTYYDSLKTAANNRVISKYGLTLDNVERSYAECVFVNHATECRALKKNGVSLNSFKILACLTDAPIGLSPIVIAGKVFLRPPEVSEALKKLEKQGYVERQRSASDQRYTYARITEQALYDLDTFIVPDLLGALTAIIPEESRSKAHQYFDIAEKIVAAMHKTKEPPF